MQTLIIIAGSFAAAAIVGVILYGRRQWRLEAQAEIVNYAKLLDRTELGENQKAWVLHSYIPKLLRYRRLGEHSGRRFKFRAKSSILLTLLGSITTIATATVLQTYWLYGLAVAGVLGPLAILSKAFDGIEGNKRRWVDYFMISSQMEDSLQELLTETPHIEINQQYAQFAAECDLIRSMETTLFEQRANESEMASLTALADAQQQLKNSREEYRANASKSNYVPVVEAETKTIPGTGITVKEFIDRSMAGDEDSDQILATGAW